MRKLLFYAGNSGVSVYDVFAASDAEFIRERLGGFKKILDYYKSEYAQKNGLLANLDKWCVVEWPANWRDGYDVDIAEGKICKTMHNVINAWYIGAIKCYNKTARKLGEPEYPGEAELVQAFQDAFYDSQRKLFKDSAESSHSSFQANIFPWQKHNGIGAPKAHAKEPAFYYVPHAGIPQAGRRGTTTLRASNRRQRMAEHDKRGRNFNV